MRFTPQFLDELRARVPVSEVVGRRVKLKRAGKEFKGLSPFQQEKTPSFTVNDQKGFYHCFSSGKHGNQFDFLMETEGLSFPEAVEQLASMAGMQVPKATREDDQREQRRRTLHDVMEMAAQFFQQTLAASKGAKARGYLADRGIDAATQFKFRLGYAPNERFALKEYLGGKGVSVADMVEVGLLAGGENIPVPYDRFFDRVMFPIGDARGRIIAFGGRALDKNATAKYLNSKETPLFHKGHNLYNFAGARQAAHDGAPVVVVEGYVDVIAMVGAGFAASVAPLGTALTEDQLALLWRMADEPILCFDGDRAGQKAAFRAADIALPHLKAGKSLRFAMLPQGQDPDDLARSGGPAAVGEVIGAARPLAEVLWLRETEGGGFDTPERRAALAGRLRALAGGIGDPDVRRFYQQDFTERLDRLFAPPAEARVAYGGRGARESARRFGGTGGGFRSAGAGRNGPSGGLASQGWGQRGGVRQPYQAASPQLAASPILRGQFSVMSSREALILLTLINHPWLLHDHLEEVAVLDLTHPEAQRLRTAITEAFAADHHHADPDEQSGKLRVDLARLGFSELLQRVEGAITTKAVWGAHPGAAESDVLSTWRQLIALHRQWHTLLKELKDAELALGREATESNMAWLIDVKARLAAVEGTEALIEGFGDMSGRPRDSL